MTVVLDGTRETTPIINYHNMLLFIRRIKDVCSITKAVQEINPVLRFFISPSCCDRLILTCLLESKTSSSAGNQGIEVKEVTSEEVSYKIVAVMPPLADR